jgi:hypothetical protein
MARDCSAWQVNAMRRSKRAAIAFATLLAVSIAAQAQEKFKGRLYPVPLDASLRAEVTGHGSISAVLEGHKLSITGSFEGLKTPATVAQIHQSPVTGVRGPAVLDVAVSKATSGNITASLDLTDEQVGMLRKGQLYIQIHSEKAPDGNLWGWILR